MVSPIKQKSRLLTIFTSILFFIFYFLFRTSYAQTSNQIRVAIIQDAQSLALKVSGFYEITDSSGKNILFRGKNLKTTVTSYKGGILMGGEEFKIDRLLIKTPDSDVLTINGRNFRGDIEFIKTSSLKLTVVNHIDLEDYIKGILYHESSHYWPMEALKAQAIVSRTYAVYQMQENKSRDYDVTSDIYSQVYGGFTSERYRTNKAVDETRGIILTYKDKAFPTFFHATCGGHTEDASMLWNINIPPLKGIPCSFCKDSPHFSWHYVLSLKEVMDKLINAGFKITNIKDMQILGRDNSSRITDLKIISAKKDFKISAKDFRNIIGPNIIRSTNFTVRIENNDLVFEGLGWGHGVGLCQWGAYFMAKKGYTAREILKYYYPQTDVKIIGF